jgi:hypothetical protein
MTTATATTAIVLYDPVGYARRQRDTPNQIPLRFKLRGRRKKKTCRGERIRSAEELDIALRYEPSIYFDNRPYPTAWIRFMQFECVMSYLRTGRLSYTRRRDEG